ncbi:ATP-binding protein [Neobacillus sp. PS3-12]|uniref:HAMP domain-containing sensor histidine kinase n=1 Tax=Neobacillus sp. PS3-12 TaxID=3070677 RepID=UPI0027E19539|nr:ATP-binding protein [Neobacillus sp. PS3-12]WML55153.1 ATP-binding protein [Neobacillus sp. PS3-12]
MRINTYIRKKSISRRFVLLMGIYFFLFALGAAAFLTTLNMLNHSYLTESYQLTKEEKITKDLDNCFDDTFFNERGYLAFNNVGLKNNAIAQEANVRKLISKYKKINSPINNQDFIQSVEEFTSYYFNDKLPAINSIFESGDQAKVVKLAKEEVTPKIDSFQKLMNNQLQKVDMENENHLQKLIDLQTEIQVVFVIIMLLSFIILLTILGYLFKQLGRPLAKLAMAADEIASGENTTIDLDTSKEDEIGQLSATFKRMAEKVQEKEQDLLAHNEELIAQQTELEDTLTKLMENKEKLKRHNQIINQISNTLNLQEVLDSIVVNMCKIIDADKGIITMTFDEAYASYGVPLSGVNQFLTHMKIPLFEQLTATKKPFSVRRQQEIADKGYHEDKIYCNDLFLPVISSTEEVIAVMMFSSFSSHYRVSEMDEFISLAKSIGISLEKISLYQKSEAERKRNQDILNTLKEGVQLIDQSGVVLQVNHYLCELFQCSYSYFIGRTWGEWTSFMKSQVIEGEFVENLTKILDSSEDSFIYTLAHSKRMIKVFCEELYHADTMLGKVLIHRDITKNYEVDQMKSELVSTVSHELRTPLSSILGFTELLLRREIKPEKQKQYLSNILSESKRLTNLINDFLDIQRMETGAQTYEKNPIKLLPILDSVIEAQQVSTKLHEIILEIDDSDPVILGDECKIKQVFTNLINNAIKYSPDGGIIKVRIIHEEDQVKIAIIDTGLGIPKDAINKLFTKFYRVDNSDRRKIGGTGLGLSIVQEIVHAHNGEIQVESEYGRGSTFIATFPVF